MQYSVYSLSVVYTLYGLLFPFKMNSKCNSRSHLQDRKYNKTVPPPQEPHPVSALRVSGCGPSGLANHFPIITLLPDTPSDATHSNRATAIPKSQIPLSI